MDHKQYVKNPPLTILDDVLVPLLEKQAKKKNEKKEKGPLPVPVYCVCSLDMRRWSFI